MTNTVATEPDSRSKTKRGWLDTTWTAVLGGVALAAMVTWASNTGDPQPTNSNPIVRTALLVELPDGDYPISHVPSPEFVKDFLHQNNQELVGMASLYQLHVKNGVPHVRVLVEHRAKQ